MYTLAGTFSLPGEMSSKTDGSTFVGLLIFIKFPFHILWCDFFSSFSVDFHSCLRWSLVPMTLRSLTGLPSDSTNSMRSNYFHEIQLILWSPTFHGFQRFQSSLGWKLISLTGFKQKILGYIWLMWIFYILQEVYHAVWPDRPTACKPSR